MKRVIFGVNVRIYGAESAVKFFISDFLANFTLDYYFIVIVAALILLCVAYKIAPNPTAAAVESYGLEGLTAGDIEMTEVLLYLTYLMFGATVAALVAGWIVGATRK